MSLVDGQKLQIWVWVEIKNVENQGQQANSFLFQNLLLLTRNQLRLLKGVGRFPRYLRLQLEYYYHKELDTKQKKTCFKWVIDNIDLMCTGSSVLGKEIEFASHWKDNDIDVEQNQL